MLRRVVRAGAVAWVAAWGVAAAQPIPIPPADPAAAVAATVNGETIPLAAVDTALKKLLPPTPLTAAQTRHLSGEVVADLVDDLLLKQFLRKHGPAVDPAEVDAHLAAFTRSLTSRGRTLAAYLKETGQTEAALRDTWVTLIQLSGYLKQHVTDAQLKQYYESNKDVFDGVEVRASRVVIRVGATAAPAERAAAREKLAAIRADVVAGKVTFADAAKKYSQCPSAPAGGDIGFIPRTGGLEDEAFARAAFALKVGEVSDVVETPSGLHLLRATDRKPGAPSAFEQRIDDVRDAFADEFRGELVAKLRKQARIHVTLP